MKLVVRGTSTTGSRAATVTRTRPRRSRTSISRGARPKPRRPFPISQWTSAGVTTLMVGGDVMALRVMAELTL